MSKHETTEPQAAEPMICSPSGWPVAEVETALERLRKELHCDDRMAARVVAFAVNHPFEEVQRAGGPWQFVLKILEQQSPEAFKALGSRPPRRQHRKFRLPKDVLRRIRNGESVQYPPGGPTWTSKQALATQNEVPTIEREPQRLQNPKDQAIVDRVLRKMAELDELPAVAQRALSATVPLLDSRDPALAKAQLDMAHAAAREELRRRRRLPGAAEARDARSKKQRTVNEKLYQDAVRIRRMRGFSWRSIAALLKISPNRLARIRHQFGPQGTL